MESVIYLLSYEILLSRLLQALKLVQHIYFNQDEDSFMISKYLGLIRKEYFC
jgi:hypothetical protein